MSSDTQYSFHGSQASKVEHLRPGFTLLDTWKSLSLGAEICFYNFFFRKWLQALLTLYLFLHFKGRTHSIHTALCTRENTNDPLFGLSSPLTCKEYLYFMWIIRIHCYNINSGNMKNSGKMRNSRHLFNYIF